jgi:hypothetical protein
MENPQPASTNIKQSWLDHSVFRSPSISLEKLLFAIILIVAIFTRFYMLEPRVMSHDETSHTYFSWLFYKGQGYAHDPVTHGPLQFPSVIVTRRPEFLQLSSASPQWLLCGITVVIWGELGHLSQPSCSPSHRICFTMDVMFAMKHS